jgi:dipeptidyl aminopeptidase/acylaminoacyl peptidase
MPQTLPYGSWSSPLSADQVSQQSLNPREIRLDGEDVYWLESRPAEQGRTTVMQLDANGTITSVLPAPYDCRSRVHEYGGGSYTVANGTLYFSHQVDNQLYRLSLADDATPAALTSDKNLRYAALSLDASRNQLLAVCEDHSADGEPSNRIVSLDLDGKTGLRTLVQGDDFYAAPQTSPDGSQLCWLSWSHPDMPWQGSNLWLANLDCDGALSNAHKIAGGKNESICQPKWSPTGELYFVSDRSNWWNIYRWRGNDGKGDAQAITARTTEFAVPQWVFGQSNYAFIGDKQILASYCLQGLWQLAQINCEDCSFTPLQSPFNQIGQVQANEQATYFIGASADRPAAVIRRDNNNHQSQPVNVKPDSVIDAGNISPAQAIEFETTDQQTAFGLFYAPKNADVKGPTNDKPPLLVIAHGGPTGAASPGFDPVVQFWTSRGFAVLAVNYRGSCNYGRDYRNSLNGQWGIADVEDCLAGARYLAQQGEVDLERMAIRGNSSGGFTVLSALTFHDLFAVGTSYYGISDLERLAQGTHKFESRYMDTLIGPYPDYRETFRQRSAINHVDLIQRPALFLQGMKDKVVPPDQAKLMVNAMRERHVRVAKVYFTDEAHGFRHAANIRTALLAELHFYSSIFGFKAADCIDHNILTQLS